MTSVPTLQKIQAQAANLGFDQMGIAPAHLEAYHHQAYQQWIDLGYHGTMDYLKRRQQEPCSAVQMVPNARSVIMLAVNYFRPEDNDQPTKEHALISRYAITRDYHKVIGKQLKTLAFWIESEFNAQTRYYIDTGPLLERGYAEAARLGFIGKNTMLITKAFGSWVFLTAIVTDLDLPPTKTATTMRCGRCQRCLDVCPTQAILSGKVLDATKCIAYLTIENRGSIPVELRPKIGTWFFGCDLCQEVCPHNSRAKAARLSQMQDVKLSDGRAIALTRILALRTHQDVVDLFAGTPIMRAKRSGIMRNAAIVAANTGNQKWLPALKKLQDDEVQREADPVILETVHWAIEQLESK